jgi:predicted transcriptional regulator
MNMSTRLLRSTASTKERPMSQTLLEMAKDLVMAQIAARNLSPDEMHQALQHTYASLQALKAQEDAKGSVAVATPETPLKPVNWRKSITKHTVMCLECRASFKQLSVRHLKEHGLDERSYRSKYGIPRVQPLAAKEITSRRKVSCRARDEVSCPGRPMWYPCALGATVGMVLQNYSCDRTSLGGRASTVYFPL